MMEQANQGNRIMKVVSTLLIMYVLTGVLLLLLAFLLFRFQLNEKAVSVGILMIYVVSCFLGGRRMAKKMRVRRFLWGILVGGVYFLVLLLGSLLLNHGLSQEYVHLAATFVMCVAAGMIGGMLG